LYKRTVKGSIIRFDRMREVRKDEQIARAAGRFAGKWMPVAKRSGSIAKKQIGKQWGPSAKHAGLFMKHVVPAAAKPIHTLWHEILGFIFLVFAGIGAFKIWQHPGSLPPLQLGIVVVFVLVMACYGISSIRRARKISRS
jgi:hypothetical protein